MIILTLFLTFFFLLDQIYIFVFNFLINNNNNIAKEASC